MFLQPIAAPSILGLYGFACATFMVTAYQVGWYGTATSPLLIFPFATAAGGIAQGVAALMAIQGEGRSGHRYPRDLGGVLAWLRVPQLHDRAEANSRLRAACSCTRARLLVLCPGRRHARRDDRFARREPGPHLSVLDPLWVGVALLGVFYTVGGSGWEKVGGYVTMASAFTAFYAASAMMLAGTFGRVILPLGKHRREANVPGNQQVYPIQFELGEPGVKQGQ